MPDWRKVIARFGYSAEDRFDALRMRLRLRAGMMKRLQVLPFRGYGTSEKIWLRGRVLKDSGLRGSLETDRIWHNVLATYRRFNSVEVPRARVRITCGDQSVEVEADNEGYFECEITYKAGEPDKIWPEVVCNLVSPAPDEHSPVTATAQILVPPPSARFGVISDIDDTIMVTNARHLLKMASATFLRNARGRVPFPGVGAFYKALQSGGGGSEQNPVFYVSSGPWNLYDLLQDFMELNSIPVGPVLLQDYGLEQGRFLKASHLDHKVREIERLLKTYPDLPFVLIGDSGQHDPEVYREVLKRAPNRIKAVYIRDVTEQARDEEVRKLGEEVREHGGTLVLVKDSVEAAEDALARGLITADSLELVRAERVIDRKAPDPEDELGPLEE